MAGVLVVDDQAGVRMLLQEVFKREGYQVEVAGDGIQAIEKRTGFLPDLILMDMQMPHMNGLEAATRILKQKPEQKIILMTASGEGDIEQQAQNVGIKWCIQKPFDIFLLSQEVERIIKSEYKE